MSVCPKNPASFNVDNVRVVKISGGGVADSSVVRGMVLQRGAEGTVKRATAAKVAVFAQGIDTSSTETKVILSPGPTTAVLTVCMSLCPALHR